MPSLRFACFAAVLMLLSPSAHAVPEYAPGCNADLAAVDQSFDETVKRLEGVANGTDAEKCAAYRHHVDIMAKGVDVFLRCMPEGHDQRENVVQLQVSIEDFETILAEKNCPSQ